MTRKLYEQVYGKRRARAIIRAVKTAREKDHAYAFVTRVKFVKACKGFENYHESGFNFYTSDSTECKLGFESFNISGMPDA